jgi:hypothetical protein
LKDIASAWAWLTARTMTSAALANVASRGTLSLLSEKRVAVEPRLNTTNG